MNGDYFDPAGSELAVLQSTSSMVVQMAQAELNQAVTTARAFPRSIKLAVDRIISLSTLDAETAAECIYALPRGGKPIKGPSVRFAEIVSAMYGNCHVGSRIVAVDRAEKVVIAEGVFFDLETGMKRVSQVQRRISDKHGKLFNDDMIAVTGNAAASIAMREAVLKGVPKAIWRKAYEAADRVTLGTAETLVARRGKAIAAFGGFGIVPEQIFASLEVGGLDDIGLEEIGILTAMFLSIKNGDAEVESYFPPKVDALAARQAARGTARAGATQASTAKPAVAAAIADVKSEVVTETVSQTQNATNHDAETGEVVDEAQVEAATDPKPVDPSPEVDAAKIIQRHRSAYATIMMALMEGKSLADAETEFAEELALMRAEAPGIHADLLAEMAGFSE